VKAVRLRRFGGPEVLELVDLPDPHPGPGELVESGRFQVPAVQAFPLHGVAEAHRVSENGHVGVKLVLVPGVPT
jgi:hypothetical protein